MREIHLRFAYSACGSLLKTRKKHKKVKKQEGNPRYSCLNKLHKVCFHHDFEDLPGRTDPQILAKLDFYPIDNNSEKKKGAKKYKPYKIPQKLLVTLLLFT